MSIDDIERVAQVLDAASVPVSMREAKERGEQGRRRRTRTTTYAAGATLCAAFGLIVFGVLGVLGVRQGPRTSRVTATSPSSATLLPRSAQVKPSPATVAEFEDLARVQAWLVGEIRTSAVDPTAVTTEIVRSTLRKFEAGAAASSARDFPVYVIQATGTTFRCERCLVPLPTPPTALRAAWDPATHAIVGVALGPPTDLGRLGHVHVVDAMPRRP